LKIRRWDFLFLEVRRFKIFQEIIKITVTKITLQIEKF